MDSLIVICYQESSVHTSVLSMNTQMVSCSVNAEMGTIKTFVAQVAHLLYKSSCISNCKQIHHWQDAALTADAFYFLKEQTIPGPAKILKASLACRTVLTSKPSKLQF